MKTSALVVRVIHIGCSHETKLTGAVHFYKSRRTFEAFAITGVKATVTFLVKEFDRLCGVI
jgi:hypothetical protein